MPKLKKENTPKRSKIAEAVAIDQAITQEREIKNKKKNILPEKQKKKFFISSIRLNEADMKGLREISDKVNAIAYGKINTSQIFRALIAMGNESSAAKVLQAIKNTI